jgi:thymidylate synthase (FAD)
MTVDLIDYTGCGTPDPSRHAANLLVFTKQTRLEMRPGLLSEIAQWPLSRIYDELDYMANTIPSSWEFVTYTFLINNVTRAFTHQFVRTRTGSYAQQTMRVLNVDGWSYGTGPTIEGDLLLEAKYQDAMTVVDAAYRELIKDGAAIEDARGVLPTNIHTNIVAKFDLRSLADTARKRASGRTQGEYRQVMNAMLEAVLQVHPWAGLFFGRTFDVAAGELEAALRAALPGDEATRLVKLLDQMRATA